MEEEITTASPTSSKKGMNPVMIVVAIIILLVLAGGVYAYMQGQNKPAPAPVENTMEPTTKVSPSEVMVKENVIEINGSNFTFAPKTITVKKGEKVTVNFKNTGGNHDFVIDEFNVKTDVIGSGKEATVSFTPDKVGTFEFYCSVGNHRAMGMKGTLTVTP